MIQNTPSSSLKDAYQRARSLARGNQKLITLICVSLVDVHFLNQAAKGKSDDWTSFSRTFFVATLPQGVTIWRPLGEQERGENCARSWAEANAFIEDFGRLVKMKVRCSWPFNRPTRLLT